MLGPEVLELQLLLHSPVENLPGPRERALVSTQLRPKGPLVHRVESEIMRLEVFTYFSSFFDLF